jgi:selenocysteine lyase/cysteine desulfurase
MLAIEAYELYLSQALLEGLATLPDLHVWGITDQQRLYQRVPTFSFSWPGRPPLTIAEQLARADIYVWNGDFYALSIVERLGLSAQGGLLRVGLAHYNTLQEIERLIDVLSAMKAI